MQPQFFYYQPYGKERFIFQSNINAEGQYSQDNNTLLGGLFNLDGKRICTTRVNFSLLKPMQHSQIKRHFPDYNNASKMYV